ncbi:HAMP domain-containing sensor histidine kinase [Campylobacter sp. RM16191]|uniref:sensor histidine kinase n=1 Tax=Campylobacter sp. RM16191 TaxID=1705728 RepID=UPI0014733FCF|nr:HAMP domain-containing sensor histidine kinase [Campylobacter sp. RM16191]
MSEKTKIISKILSLYLITSALFLSYFSINDYKMAKEALISNEVKNLKEIKMGIYMKASMNGINSAAALMQEKQVSACIVSKEGKIIYQDTECLQDTKKNVAFLKDGKVVIYEALQSMESNATGELSTANILLEGRDIRSDLNILKLKILGNLLLILTIIMVIAYYLAKLSLEPLHTKINALNRFIKDSTHEINTPLSIIMMSIETTDKSTLSSKNLKRLNNIELAARSLSNIYEDLTYLSFSKSDASKKEQINLKNLFNERLEYFAPFFAKRSIIPQINLSEASINANLYEVRRMIDNLISNAIKYSNVGGFVSIILSKNEFAITNSGEGISKEQQKKIYDRYTRFNNDQGGFGIGLNLVKRVCESNDLSIICESEIGQNTTFKVSWS